MDPDEEDEDGDNEEDGPSPSPTAPSAATRRGSALLTVIGAVLLALGHHFFWHGADTPQIAALLLFLLSVFTIFQFIQLLTGVPFGELYRNFWSLSAKQKALYIGMIAAMLALLWPFCGSLFPDIESKLRRY